MKNKGCVYTFFVIISNIIILICFWILYCKYHTFGRSYVTNVKSVGYKISFSEIEHDSILAFSFERKDCNMKKQTLFVHNNSFDVVSFFFTKDTVYIRDNIDFYDLFSPEERVKLNLRPNYRPKNFQKEREPTIPPLPSFCKIIPHTDSRFFVYAHGDYTLKDSTIHMIKLTHYTERANEYRLYDQSLNDFLEIPLYEITMH